MIAYFQEFRKNTDKTSIAQILDKRENQMLRVMVNSEFMVPCVKEETEEEVSIAHHFIDVTEQVSHKDGEQVIANPAFTASPSKPEGTIIAATSMTMREIANWRNNIFNVGFFFTPIYILSPIRC